MDLQLSFDQLMAECGFDDPVAFVRILKKNDFHVRREKPVPFDTAQAIVARLQRRRLDPYKFKLEARDEYEGGPLRWSATPSILDMVTKWYRRLMTASAVDSSDRVGSSLIGFVSQGGFLGADEDTPFIFSVRPGVNILIGERGAGKSTALNLFGLLAAGERDGPNILLNRLISLLQGEPDVTSVKNRRIRQSLRHYSVVRYVCFYRRSGETFAYAIDLDAATFALLKRLHDHWEFVSSDETADYMPSMHVLQQGEVFKIADETNRYYLNVLIDALFPDIREHRTSFFRRVRKLAAQYAAFETHQRKSPTRHNKATFDRFFSQRLTEAGQLRAAGQRQKMTDVHVEILRRWLTEVQLPPIHTQTLEELFQDGSESALWSALFARMRRFRRLDLSALLTTAERSASPAKSEADDIDDRDLMVVTTSATDLDESEDELQDGSADDFAQADPDMAQAIEDPWSLLSNVADRVRRRLFVINGWIERLSTVPQLDAQLSGLATSYIAFLDDYATLMRKQEAGCAHIEEVLNRDASVHRVHTRNVNSALAEAESFSARLQELPEVYQRIQSLTPRTDPVLIDRAISTYAHTVIALEDRCRDVTNRASDPDLSTLVDPIEVELKQGREYMPFEKLSFGQRSGIILKSVLGTTANPVIVLDQPEDNLDAHAVEALATTLKNLGRSRQIIVATHHSSLVMGIPDATLYVMASHGGAGVVHREGRLADRELTRAVLDVLEGGEESFQHKMRTYADFLERLQGFIHDMEISEIESTFRRRTIDNLRNFLQPVVSNEAMLHFYQHELRTLAGPDIETARNAVNEQLKHGGPPSPDLLASIGRVIDKIRVHINQFQEKIEQLRLLDTHPHPEVVDLGSLLDAVVAAIHERQGRSRNITVELQSELHGTFVKFDPQHLRLIFENLFNNALRATEQQALDALYGHNAEFHERVSVGIADGSASTVTLLFADNGRGIPDTLRDKLYMVRCSDQFGEHGLGGVLIRKMLDLNGGDIKVLESGQEVGTLQSIRLQRGVLE
jgi:signal transduction histidine kinase